MRYLSITLVLLALIACDSSRRPGGGSVPTAPRDGQVRSDVERGSDEDGSGDFDAGDGHDGEVRGDDAEAHQDARVVDATPFDAAEARDAITFPDAQQAPDAHAPDAFVPGDACGELAACCGQIPPPLSTQCMSTASAGDQARCSGTLTNARTLGFCGGGGGDGGASPPDVGFRDSGVHPDASAPRDASTGTACRDLLPCCATLPDPANCNAVAVLGIDVLCAAMLVQCGP